MPMPKVENSAFDHDASCMDGVSDSGKRLSRLAHNNKMGFGPFFCYTYLSRAAKIEIN